MKKITILSACLFAGLTFAQTNLLTNGDFETGSTSDGWNDGGTAQWKSYGTEAVDDSEIEPYNGNWCGKKQPWSSNFVQVIDVTENETYEFKFWHRIAEGQGSINTTAKIREIDAQGAQGAWLDLEVISEGNADNPKNFVFTSVDTQWTESKLRFTVPSGVTKIRTNFWTENWPARYFDDMSISVESTASNNKLSKFNFSYAPNPANNVINLNAAKTISNVEFYNNLGQNVLATKVNALSSNLNISGLNKGIYMMNVTIDGQTQAFKILKQ